MNIPGDTSNPPRGRQLAALFAAECGIELDAHSAARLAAAAENLAAVLDRADAKLGEGDGRLDEEPSTFDAAMDALAERGPAP